MSRDYEQTCPECSVDNARSMYVKEDIEVLQCLNKECGACFAILKKYVKLKARGTTESIWSLAYKEAEKSKW